MDRPLFSPDDATRIEAVPLHGGVDSLDLAPGRRRGDTTPEDLSQEQRAVAAAVAEVREGRLELDMTAVRMAPTGTDVSSLVPRPLVRPATASPLPRTDDELTPGGTLVRLNPILLRPTDPTDDETTTNGTVVKLNPLLLVPQGANTEAKAPAAAPPVGSGLGPVPAPPYAEREPRPTLFGMPAPSVSAPQPPAKRVVPSAAPAKPTPVARPTAALHANVVDSYSGEANVGTQTLAAPMGEPLEIGSKPGSAFAGDPYVARYHAALLPGPDGVKVEDFGSTNGVYARVDGSVELPSGPSTQPGGVRCFGSPDPGYWGRVRIMLEHQRSASAIALRKPQSEIGRDGACTLAFPDDDQLSAQHCTIVRNGPGIRLDDAGSEHGTWVRLRPGQTVPYGTELLVGDTRVRLDRAT